VFFLKDVKYKSILDIKNLHIMKNKITCIVGESGSGKTTLLKLLNKMLSPDEGKIFYNGRSIRDMNSIELRRKVVMLSQVPLIFSGSIRDNLLMGLKFSEKPLVSDTILYNILEIVNLHKDLEETADKLSGGEKQRLSLGRILLIDPDVYLLDEPSSSLDEDTEEVIIEKLVSHTKSANKTLVMVTHSKRIAKTFADNIIEIKQGKIVI
jgi:putative ABC transport system ATP-binding protein